MELEIGPADHPFAVAPGTMLSIAVNMESLMVCGGDEPTVKINNAGTGTRRLFSAPDKGSYRNAGFLCFSLANSVPFE